MSVTAWIARIVMTHVTVNNSCKVSRGSTPATLSKGNSETDIELRLCVQCCQRFMPILCFWNTGSLVYLKSACCCARCSDSKLGLSLHALLLISCTACFSAHHALTCHHMSTQTEGVCETPLMPEIRLPGTRCQAAYRLTGSQTHMHLIL